MMKPSTLAGLICLCSLPLQGAEQASAPSPAPAPAISAPAAMPASAPSLPVPETAAAAAVSTPIQATAAPLPTASPPAVAPSAPLPSSPLPVAPPSGAAPSSPITSGLQAVPLYRQDELLNWIEQGRHLTRVKQDRCQLTQDIEARASVMKIPSYQFLWGDMLAWGVCVKPDAQIGVQYMWEAANQGLAPALEQLGRYYWKGILVQKDLVRAETLMREAASLGFLRAQLEWVEMLLQGMGSPLDYEEAYHWLHGAVIGDKATHQKAASLLSRLGNRMPANAIARAKAMR